MRRRLQPLSERNIHWVTDPRPALPSEWGLRMICALIGGGFSLLLSLPMIFNGWFEHAPGLIGVALIWQLVGVPYLSAIVASTGVAACGGPWLSERMLAAWYLVGICAPSAFVWASWSSVWTDLALWLGPPMIGILFLRDQCGSGSKGEGRWLERFHTRDQRHIA